MVLLECSLLHFLDIFLTSQQNRVCYFLLFCLACWVKKKQQKNNQQKKKKKENTHTHTHTHTHTQKKKNNNKKTDGI